MGQMGSAIGIVDCFMTADDKAVVTVGRGRGGKTVITIAEEKSDGNQTAASVMLSPKETARFMRALIAKITDTEH